MATGGSDSDSSTLDQKLYLVRKRENIDQERQTDLEEDELNLYNTLTSKQRQFPFTIPESAIPVYNPDSETHVGYMSENFAGKPSSLISELSLKCGKSLADGVDGQCFEANKFVHPFGTVFQDETEPEAAAKKLREKEFGTVFQDETEPDAAAKKLREKEFNNIEVEFLFKANHPNIVGLHGFFTGPDESWLLMEFIPGKPLHERLRAEPDVTLSDALSIYRDLLTALAVLEENHVVHKDIKEENVIIKGSRATLIDFSRALKLDTPGLSANASTLYFCDLEDATSCFQSCLKNIEQPPYVKDLLDMAADEEQTADSILGHVAFSKLVPDAN